MACSNNFIEFVCSTLAPLGVVSSRKMMGDYIIYLNGKKVITACDDNAYVPKLSSIREIMADAESASPYPGAKEAYILDFTDIKKVLQVVEKIWEVLPYPRSRK